MYKFLTLVAFGLLSLGMAGASSIPCVVNTGFDNALTSSTVVTCGGLTFNNFEVLNPQNGAAGLVNIIAGSYNDPSCPNEVCLSFNPNLQTNQDEELLFQVWGGINQIDMSVGGQNASITELACSSPVPMSGVAVGECPQGAMLGQITVVSNEVASVVNCSSPTCTTINPTSPVYIFKDISVGPGGGLSEFTQSFNPAGVPEPATLLLLGTGLFGLGLLRRRSGRK